jgi:hypothetical protein
MKPVYVLLLALLPFFADAQEASEVEPLPNGGSMRHQILLNERKAIADELTEAVNAHPKAEDKAASLESIRRLESNLRGIDAEIRRAATEAPTVADFKPTPATEPAQTTQPENLRHEAWDVFQDFGTQKGK